jgi:hypothetical protein
MAAFKILHRHQGPFGAGQLFLEAGESVARECGDAALSRRKIPDHCSL